MRLPQRSVWLSVAGFALVAAVVLGGLTWATIASLGQEHARAEKKLLATHHGEFKLVSTIVDSYVDGQLGLGLEGRRPHHHYDPTYCAAPGDEVDRQDLYASRLSCPIVHETLPDSIRLHFQVSLRNGWQSPQLLHSTSREVRRWRDRLASSLTMDDLSRQLADGEWFSNWIGSEELHDATGTAPDDTDNFSPLRRLAAQLYSPPETCEPALFINEGTLDASDEDDGPLAGDGDLVTVHDLVPIWLDLGSTAPRELAYVRRVDFGDDLFYQGFLVDWEKLSASLLPLIHELYPQASLTPVTDPGIGTMESRLLTLPVALDLYGDSLPASTSRWEVLGTPLALAWGAALIVLAVVGFGMRSLLSFADRSSQFGYAVTHELRTPLTTLRLYSDMLAGGVVKDEQKRNEYIQTMDRETQRLVGLVNDVLEFARLEKHDVQLDRRPISLGELAEISRERLEPRCQQAGQALTFDINGLAETHVDTDRQLLLQILDILIDNACKYAGTSGRSAIEIRTVRLPNGRLALEVQDDGPGIPRKNRRAIFRPFRRGCSIDSQPASGIGLGLALAKRWARLLDGHLELLAPSPNRSGACFRFTFPK